MDEPAPEQREQPADEAKDAATGTMDDTVADTGKDTARDVANDTVRDSGAAQAVEDTDDSAGARPVGQRPESAPEPAKSAGRAIPQRVVFRIPGSAYVAIAFLAMCTTFVGFAAPWLTVVFLLPLAAIYYVARTRTVVDADRLVVRTVLATIIVPWAAVKSLRISDRGRIRVVRTDGGEIPLPSVRTRHLPAIALISRGRISDPTAAVDHGPV